MASGHDHVPKIGSPSAIGAHHVGSQAEKVRKNIPSSTVWKLPGKSREEVLDGVLELQNYLYRSWTETRGD